MHAGPGPSHPVATAVTFRPPRLAGIATGSGFALLSAVAALLAGFIAARSEPELRTALGWLAAGGLGIAALLFASWTFSVATLAYRLEAGNLVVRWGLRSTEVALSSIQSVMPGRTVDRISVRGINWLGCHVGEAELRRFGPTLVFATTIEPESLVFVTTETEVYGLSVARQAEFVEEIESHRKAGPPPHHPQHTRVTGIAALPVWRDRTALAALLTAFFGCALVVGFVFGQYPSVAPIIETNFPGSADVVRVGSKQELLGIAYLAAAVVAVNSAAGVMIHARDRAAGIWMLASGTLLQAVLLLAAIIAFERA